MNNIPEGFELITDPDEIAEAEKIIAELEKEGLLQIFFLFSFYPL